ncbi:MAG TPA: CRTAC1 family protein, partial [Candidatus Deferrimicrobiaceae bacterium]
AWSSAAFDYDGDGWDDLYVSNGRYPAGEKNLLFRNRGDGTFEEVTDKAGVGDEQWALGTGVADIDNDGWLDLYVSNYVGRNTMYRNNGDGTFKDISKESGTDNDGWGKGPAFGDTDHDGLVDLYEGDCKFSNQFYHNNGNCTFTDIVNKYPFMKLETIRSKGAAFVDFDNDGDLDLYVVNWEVANSFYRNDQNDRNWIKVRAVGTTFGNPSVKYRSTRDAVGAKVRVFQGGKLVGYREVMAANGFCSNPPLEVHFGVDAKYLYDVEVTFPSGIRVLRKGVVPGAAYEVREEG